MVAENSERRISQVSTSADENTPLLLPPEDFPISPSASTEIDTEQQSNDGSSTDVEGDNSPSRSIHLIVLVMIVGVFIGNLDTSFVLTTHDRIASEFDALSKSSWIIISYSLAMCAVQPWFGKLSDIFGHKQSLVGSYLVFALGCLICGMAKSLPVVILGRVISGVGGAGCNTVISLIILDLVPLRQVAVLRSYINIAATTGRSLGGPIGGALADTIGWRNSFIFQCPLLMIATVLAIIFVPKSDIKGQDQSLKQRLSRIDVPGALLLALTILGLLSAVELSGEDFGWRIILPLIAGSLVSGALFTVTELRWAKEPIYPLHLLKNRDLVCCYLLALFQVAAQLGMMFDVPIYFEVTQNVSSSLAGAHLFPAVAGNAIGALLTGLVIRKTGKPKILAVIATIVSAICYTVLILRWHGNTGFWESLYIIPGGFGMGMVEASSFVILSAAVEKSMQHIALAGLFLSINIGMIAGLAGSSAVLSTSARNQLTQRLGNFKNRDEIIQRAISDIGYVKSLTGKLKDLVVLSYVNALRDTHAVSLASAVAGFFVAIFIRQKRI